MNTITVDYRGITLELEGQYFTAVGSSWDEESLGDSFETYSVLAGGVDIVDIFSEDQLDELDQLGLEGLS
jgi:hypothetical protein